MHDSGLSAGYGFVISVQVKISPSDTLGLPVYQHNTPKHVSPFKSNHKNYLSTSTMSLSHPTASARKALGMLPPSCLALELQSHTAGASGSRIHQGRERLDRNIINAAWFFMRGIPCKTQYTQLHVYQLLWEVVFIPLLCNKFMQNTQLRFLHTRFWLRRLRIAKLSSQIAHILLLFQSHWIKETN